MIIVTHINFFYDCFSQHDSIFTDVSKIYYFRSPENNSKSKGKGDDIIISVDEVTSKISPGDTNSILDVVMGPRFGDYSISIREVLT